MARYRQGSVFVRDLREHSIPLDRNQIARILYLADALERRTKAKGCRNGALGQVGLVVLRVLALRFLNRATGLCCPSYDAIMHATGFCRQTVARALQRLAWAGILRWTRRIERAGAAGRPRQASNLYRISEPTVAAVKAPALDVSIKQEFSDVSLVSCRSARQEVRHACDTGSQTRDRKTAVRIRANQA